MKSNTRTVLSTSITSASSYSSGELDVGDLFELAIDCNATAITYTSGNLNFRISRIGADGNLYTLGDIDFSSHTAPASLSASVGGGLILSGDNIPFPFGDQIQVDLIADTGNSITTTLSIKGKG